MTFACAATGERAITDRLSSAFERSIDDPRYLGMHRQENYSSSSALALNPLHDASLNTLNISSRIRTFSDYEHWCFATTSHYVQSSDASPISNVTPVSASHLSASWDKRFLKLEQTSPDATTLLKFLHSLQSDKIPEIIFCRMWTTRECWSCDNELEHVNILLNGPLVDLLTRQSQFHENIQLLESLGFIKSESGALGKRKFSIKLDLQDRIKSMTQNPQELE